MATNARTKNGGRGLRILYAILLLGIAIVLLGMGSQLILLGGSAYYVCAGLLTGIAGIYILRDNWRGSWFYYAMLAGTVLWALWEAGTDGWALVARLAAPFVLAIPMFIRELGRIRSRRGAIGVAAAGLALCVAVPVLLVRANPAHSEDAPAPQLSAFDPAADKVPEWRHVAGGLHGRKYVPFTEINTTNVRALEPAWVYRAGSRIVQATPLQIGANLYLCTADNIVISLAGDTGAERWRHDPKLAPRALGRGCRGVVYHESVEADGACQARIFVGTRDARLIALDAETGAICADFADNGTIDLKSGMGTEMLNMIYQTSPPIVVGDTLIVGGAIYDGQSLAEPSGVVRAFDARTGAFLWAWDMGRPGINTEPDPGESYTPGTPNVWSLLSADPELGLVYLPTGNPTPDYFGGYRSPEMEKFGSSIVALDVRDGSVRWSFQTVHHDIWDYDVASQPILLDFPVGNTSVPAVIQPTKRGELFVLDRRTGDLLAEVEERPTPQGAADGDFTAPTQPFSVGMPSLAGGILEEKRMWGITPIDQLWCRIKFRQARYDGPMTPPGLDVTLRYPGYSGGQNWGSVSIDEASGILIAPSLHMPNIDQLLPKDSPEAAKFLETDEYGIAVINPGIGGPQRGTPYAVTNLPFLSPLEVPCMQPPYGKLVAIDLKTRKTIWEKPVGTTRNSGPFGLRFGLPLPMGVPVNGGALVTGSGLTFFAGAQDGYLRAIATRTGEELWRTALPVGSEATPMSFVSPTNGRQMLVLTAGGAVGTTQTGDYVIAYKLPSD